MVKIHDKISGTFRSSAGAESFATIRSYIQTAANHNLNRLDVLRQLFTTGPWPPPNHAAGTCLVTTGSSGKTALVFSGTRMRAGI